MKEEQYSEVEIFTRPGANRKQNETRAVPRRVLKMATSSVEREYKGRSSEKWIWKYAGVATGSGRVIWKIPEIIPVRRNVFDRNLSCWGTDGTWTRDKGYASDLTEESRFAAPVLHPAPTCAAKRLDRSRQIPPIKMSSAKHRTRLKEWRLRLSSESSILPTVDQTLLTAADSQKLRSLPRSP